MVYYRIYICWRGVAFRVLLVRRRLIASKAREEAIDNDRAAIDATLSIPIRKKEKKRTAPVQFYKLALDVFDFLSSPPQMIKALSLFTFSLLCPFCFHLE